MNPVEKEKRMISDEELLEHFEVEELEERFEFARDPWIRLDYEDGRTSITIYRKQQE